MCSPTNTYTAHESRCNSSTMSNIKTITVKHNLILCLHSSYAITLFPYLQRDFTKTYSSLIYHKVPIKIKLSLKAKPHCQNSHLNASQTTKSCIMHTPEADVPHSIKTLLFSLSIKMLCLQTFITLLDKLWNLLYDAVKMNYKNTK